MLISYYYSDIKENGHAKAGPFGSFTTCVDAPDYASDFRRVEHVIGCGHVSGLICAAIYMAAGRDGKFADQIQIKGTRSKRRVIAKSGV